MNLRCTICEQNVFFPIQIVHLTLRIGLHTKRPRVNLIIFATSAIVYILAYWQNYYRKKSGLLHKGKSVTNLHLYVHASVCECAKGGQWKQSNTGTGRGLRKAVVEVTCHSASYRTLAYKAGHAGLD